MRPPPNRNHDQERGPPPPSRPPPQVTYNATAYYNLLDTVVEEHLGSEAEFHEIYLSAFAIRALEFPFQQDVIEWHAEADVWACYWDSPDSLRGYHIGFRRQPMVIEHLVQNSNSAPPMIINRHGVNDSMSGGPPESYQQSTMYGPNFTSPNVGQQGLNQYSQGQSMPRSHPARNSKSARGGPKKFRQNNGTDSLRSGATPSATGKSTEELPIAAEELRAKANVAAARLEAAISSKNKRNRKNRNRKKIAKQAAEDVTHGSTNSTTVSIPTVTLSATRVTGAPKPHAASRNPTRDKRSPTLWNKIKAPRESTSSEIGRGSGRGGCPTSSERGRGNGHGTFESNPGQALPSRLDAIPSQRIPVAPEISLNGGLQVSRLADSVTGPSVTEQLVDRILMLKKPILTLEDKHSSAVNDNDNGGRFEGCRLSWSNSEVKTSSIDSRSSVSALGPGIPKPVVWAASTSIPDQPQGSNTQEFSDIILAVGDNDQWEDMSDEDSDQ